MIGQSSIIKFVLGGLLFFGIGVIFLNFFSSNEHQHDRVLTKKADTYVPSRPVGVVLREIEADFKSDIQPRKLIIDNSKIDISKVSIRKYKISIKNEKDEEILVRETGKGNYHVLLLHGQGSSSKIWEDIGTLQYLSIWGYRAFAIDLPSSLSRKKDKEAIQWLTQLIDKLQLKNLVIISPSMSGRLILPYIFQLNKQQKLIRGFVPIAPVGTNRFRVDNYKQIKIPTLIVHGEKDVKFQDAFEILKQIPTSKILLIKNASHASYIEKPIEFHNELRQFLYNIYRPIYNKPYKLINRKFLVSNTTKRAKKLRQ